MPRNETVQLNVQVVTDESRALAKANKDTRVLTQELRKTVKQGGDVADVLRRIEEAGGEVADIDLTKVAPAQLVTRARQLKQVLDRIPASAPQAARLREEYKRINDRLADIRQSTRGVASSLGGGRAGLIGRLGGVVAAVTAAVAAFRGLFSVVSDGVNRAAEFEQLNVALGTFLGSAEKARDVIKDLNEFSVATPFEPEQVNRAGKALLAFGIEQEKLIPSLRQIGDVAAGTGKDFNELTLIYGKARAAGRIQGEELNQLAEAGIPIYEELGKVVGANASDIRKLGEQGKLSFEDLQAVFSNLTSEGGRFNGLLEKQSKTLSGLTSTARGALAELSRNLAGAFTPLLKTILPPIISLINRITTLVGPLATAVGKKLVLAFQFLQKAFAPLIAAGQRLAASFSDVASGTGVLSSAIQLLGSLLSLVVNVVSTVVEQVSRLLNVFSFFGGGSGGIIQRVLTNPLKFAIQAITRFVAVLNGLISASRVAFDSIGNIGSIFFNTVALAFDQIKGLLTDNEGAIAARQNSLATAYAGLGKKLGDAFRQGYNDALGNSLPGINNDAPEDSRRKTGQVITRPQQPDVTASERKAQEVAANEAARIAKLRAERELDVVAATIGGGPSITSVSQRDVDAQLQALEEQGEREAEVIQRQRDNQLIGEEQFALAKLNLKRDLLAQEIEILRQGTAEEVALANEKAAQIGEIDRQIFDQKAVLAERERQLRAEVEDAKRELFSSGLDAVGELLGRDEAALKKNAGAIKAFEIGRAVIAGQQEIQQINLAAAAQAAINPLGAPFILAAAKIRSIQAGIRTAISVGKIAATKFARGGLPKFGTFGGRSHAGGGTRGVFEDGTQIEVEAGETFAVVNKRARGLLGFLSQANVATGGVSFFSRGGVVAGPSTTPIIGPETAAATPGGGAATAALTEQMRRMEIITANLQNIKANVVLTEIEAAQSDLDAARAAAEV